MAATKGKKKLKKIKTEEASFKMHDLKISCSSCTSTVKIIDLDV